LTEKSFNNLAGKKVYLLFFGHFEFFLQHQIVF
jgi:hypothetical protein